MFDFAPIQDAEKIRCYLKDRNIKIYMVGIGGVGMCALAHHLSGLGYSVSGCDRARGEWVDTLLSAKIPVSVGEGSVPPDTGLVVASLAIPHTSRELASALSMGIPVTTRPALLGAVMTDYGVRIGVSGTHGKSSTVAMLDRIFSASGLSPTTLSGAALSGGMPYNRGRGECFIYEGCEYRDAFLHFSPSTAVITSAELDHTDYFKSREQYISSFVRAASSARDRVVLNADDDGCKSISKMLPTPPVTVGRRGACDYIYTPLGDNASFRLRRGGKELGVFTLDLTGEFFSTDGALAVVAALECGVSVEDCRVGLSEYRGIQRRMQALGVRWGREIIYDYAHHPTEMRAVITSVKKKFGKCTVVFCPHTYTRTAALWWDFVNALRLADHAVLVDVYAAREEALRGVNSPSLARDVGGRAVYLAEDAVLPYVLNETLGPVIVVGAGDMTYIRSSLGV